MTRDADAAKAALRLRMRALLGSIADGPRATAGRAVVDALLEAAGAGPVAYFASMGGEISTTPLDDAFRGRGLVRALPQVVGADLVFRSLPASVAAKDLGRAAYGAPEPTVDFVMVELVECACVIVPGLAFDARGNRLGYGRGFYDRALAGVDPERCVGLGFDAQLVDEVPAREGDVPLRRLCTPERGLFRTQR